MNKYNGDNNLHRMPKPPADCTWWNMSLEQKLAEFERQNTVIGINRSNRWSNKLYQVSFLFRGPRMYRLSSEMLSGNSTMYPSFNFVKLCTFKYLYLLYSPDWEYILLLALLHVCHEIMSVGVCTFIITSQSFQWYAADKLIIPCSNYDWTCTRLMDTWCKLLKFRCNELLLSNWEYWAFTTDKIAVWSRQAAINWRTSNWKSIIVISYNNVTIDSMPPMNYI